MHHKCSYQGMVSCLPVPENIHKWELLSPLLCFHSDIECITKLLIKSCLVLVQTNFRTTKLNTKASVAWTIKLMGPGAGMHFQWETPSSMVCWTTLHICSCRPDCYLTWRCFIKLHRKSNTLITSKQSCPLLMQTILKAKAKQHLAVRPLSLRCLPANLKIISDVLNWLICLSLFPVQ